MQRTDDGSFFVRSVDGTRLRAKWTLPASEAAATVVFVHGFGEHLGRHERVAQVLSQNSIAVLRFDLRGHGYSEGARADVRDYRDLLDDVDAMVAQAKAEFSSLPLTLYGHSLGGGIAANWAIHRALPHVRSLVLSSPWFLLHDPPGWWKSQFFRIAAGIWPGKRIRTGVKAEQLSHEASEQSEFRNDPLIIREISLRLAVMAVDRGRDAVRRASECLLPTLVIHGTDDQLTAVEGSTQFAARAPHAQLRLFDGYAHEMHREENWGDVLETVGEWILKRDDAQPAEDSSPTASESQTA